MDITTRVAMGVILRMVSALAFMAAHTTRLTATTTIHNTAIVHITDTDGLTITAVTAMAAMAAMDIMAGVPTTADMDITEGTRDTIDLIPTDLTGAIHAFRSLTPHGLDGLAARE